MKANRLRESFAAVRVGFTWFGVRRALTPDQVKHGAESFAASSDFISMSKRLLDIKHPRWKAVCRIRGDIRDLWRGMSLPYPEPGIRLIRQEDIPEFDQRLEARQAELASAVTSLDAEYAVLRDQARERLGTLFDARDYPLSLQGLFSVEWDYPSVDPPDYLMKLNPKLYEEQKARIEARFDQAVKMAEEAFTSEFAKLVQHLVERLGSAADGKKHVFRDTAVTNLNEFFDRFRALKVGDSQALDTLVNQAQGLLRNVDPQDVRDNEALREQLRSRMSEVQQSLDGMTVEAPRRKILRATEGEKAA